MDLIASKIHDITMTLLDYIKNNSQRNSIGIYDGQFGILLFLTAQNQYFEFKDFDEEIYDVFIKKCIEDLCDIHNSYTFCSGVIGALESLKQMNAAGWFDVDYSDIENNYRPLLLRQLKIEFEDQNYDFLHGGLGISFYFNDDPEFIEQTIIGLEKNAIKNADTLKWKSILDFSMNRGINIALSHGMASIVVYLSRIHHTGVLTERVNRLLEGTVNYILTQEIDRNKYGSCFVSQSLENKDEIYSSRLAWCYGDLGIAAALWQAGKIMRNSEWQKKALDVFEFSTKRLNPSNTKVFDAELCHGSAGVAMIFDYIFKELNSSIFKEARDYWINETLNYGHFANGAAGYLQYYPMERKGHRYVKSYSLLDGIAGIGMSLLSIYSKVSRDILHRLFLLY